MDKLTERELIEKISGPGPDGRGKCAVSIQEQRCNENGNLDVVQDEYITEKPVVQVFKQAGGYVLVDLIFESIQDADLRNIYLYLSRFFQATNSASDNEFDFPLLSLSILPKEFCGKYWALGLNPIFYTLTPEDSTGEPKIIRMVYKINENPDAVPNFLFLSSSDEELDKIHQDDDVN